MNATNVAAKLIVGLAALASAAGWIGLVDASFNYQGQLQDDNRPAEGHYDLKFTLYDEYDLPIGLTNEFYNHPVTNGLFDVVLNFGDGAFGNESRYLEVQVRPAGEERPFVTLTPRQQIRAVPYAATALNTLGIDGHSLDAQGGTFLDVVFVDSDGHVGIRTNTPDEDLHVEGTIRMLSLRLGDHATPGYVLTADANGYATWQPAGTGPGSCHWERDNSDNIFYGDGFVGINMGAAFPPEYPLHVIGIARMDGLKLGDMSTPGHVLTADAYGNATWQEPPTGTGSCVWSRDGEDNIRYGDGYVGINMGTSMTPQHPLHVHGTARMNGFQLGSIATAGHVLTTDAYGYGTWQPAGAGNSPWTIVDTGITHPGKVGIGVTNPQEALHVESDSLITLLAVNNNNVSPANAIRGESSSPDARVVAGYALSNTGTHSGVYGRAYSSNGRGVTGVNSAGGYAVYGAASEDTGGWAGYFTGRGYFGGNVGIGTTAPQEKLHVAGTVRMNGLKLGTSATPGHVLTTDAYGVGTWQPASGGGSFTLPVDESVTADHDAALKITNNGSGTGTYGIYGRITGAASEEAAAGCFRADGGGMAIQAFNASGTAIYASSGGTAVSAHSSGGAGGYFSASTDGGYGVKGVVSSSANSSESRGGWFVGNGTNARGLFAQAMGSYGRAVHAEATGGEGVGVYATSPWIAMQARSNHYAAKFYGQFAVYEYGTVNQVFKVNDNTGETTVQVLKIEGGADLSEPFDIEENSLDAQPGMIVSIDPDNVGKLMISQTAYDHKVAGVISGAGGIKPGMVMGQAGTIAHGTHPVALTGRVWTLCDATTDAIEPGDLLTTAHTPGHAMKAADSARTPGAIIGKAMSRLESGKTGLVLVLVNLQ